MAEDRLLDESDEFYRSVGGVRMMRGPGEAAWYFGWIPRNNFVERIIVHSEYSLFEDAAATLVGSGSGRTTLLYQAARKVMGQDLDSGPQQIGDCVSWGFGGAIDLLACVEVLAGEREEYSWDMRACTEAIYAMSRVEYGTFGGSFADGSTGRWAADAIRRGGTLSRQLLGAYSGKRATEWGAAGLPDEFEPMAREHRVLKTALVANFEQARDAISNGYPVAVCSDQGFTRVRDQDGFVDPSASWSHCMKFVAAKDDTRPALLCMNSWGPPSVGGDKGQFDIPDAAFWVDADVCTKMLRQGDSYALGSFDGYQLRQQVIASMLA